MRDGGFGRHRRHSPGRPHTIDLDRRGVTLNRSGDAAPISFVPCRLRRASGQRYDIQAFDRHSQHTIDYAFIAGTQNSPRNFSRKNLDNEKFDISLHSQSGHKAAVAE